MKKWHCYINDIFDGYAPNRLKARGWAAKSGTVVSDSKHCIFVVRGNDKLVTIYKEVDQ